MAPVLTVVTRLKSSGDISFSLAWSSAILDVKVTDSATCNTCLCKGGNTLNLTKHLTTHGIFLKAEKCAIFHSLLLDPTLSTSAAASRVSIPVEERPSPASVVEMTDDDHSGLSSSGE